MKELLPSKTAVSRRAKKCPRILFVFIVLGFGIDYKEMFFILFYLGISYILSLYVIGSLICLEVKKQFLSIKSTVSSKKGKALPTKNCEIPLRKVLILANLLMRWR